MRISKAHPEDSATLTRIAFGAKRHWGYPESWIRRWKDVLTITPGYIRTNPTYKARKGAEIVGFCALVLDGDEARVDHLWVVPAAMGRGVGRSLFTHCEKMAKKMGASRLKIESDPNAEGFYQAMGASTLGRRRASMSRKERFLPLLEKSLG